MPVLQSLAGKILDRLNGIGVFRVFSQERFLIIWVAAVFLTVTL